MALYNLATALALRGMAVAFNRLPGLRGHLKNSEGWINFSVGICTGDGKVSQTISFREGRVRVCRGIHRDASVVLRARDHAVLREMASAPPNDILIMMLRNRITLKGNMSYLQLFNYYLSLLIGGRQQRMLDRRHRSDRAARRREYGIHDPELSGALKARQREGLNADNHSDPCVAVLADPYLSEMALQDFPRLARLLERHRDTRPELCAERPAILTAWFRENGFERDNRGRPWHPVLRQGRALAHLMASKAPVIAADQLLAGTTTASDICGVVVYPDAQGTMAWGELGSIDKRHLNPYDISDDTRKVLSDIFPFWARRNFRELAREKFNTPLGLEIDERFVAYFCWKSVGISHTAPDFKAVLEKGTEGIRAEIEVRLRKEDLAPDARDSLKGMAHGLMGLEAYAANLARQARQMAHGKADGRRRRELMDMAAACDRVPRRPPESLAQAFQSIWITWIGLHMENTNTGLSIGRMDQWLQPYFLADVEKCLTPEAVAAYVRDAVELTACFFLRLTDHMPLSPDIGNYLFGGSPADQAITLGGMTPEGKDGVNDMTYICLKVTEMLCLHDPNVNARISPSLNSDTYVRRLCEVNYTTSATPSMHNDDAVFASLSGHGYPEEDLRDWCAIGCVEQTIAGRHCGHTGSILMNMVAALEMALNNGRHPLMEWDLGPETGTEFPDFEAFFEAYAAQQRFLIGQAVALNNIYAEIHAQYRPTPLLSALTRGCIEQGRDLTRGGALYNTSGASNIGLADVTDSLMAVKTLVFDRREITFAELKAAVDNNFEGFEKIHALVRNRVPLFGSGSPEALAMADRVTGLIHGIYAGHRNFRGGPYTSGFWSMSQHVAYGNLSGALPSGRRAGKAFTPGLTPQPHASRNYLDFISDVAGLTPDHMDNNIAFNVKLVPGDGEREGIIDAMAGYVKAYCAKGGMQIQFNMVDSRVLKDAMANPENYRNLLVRISGYNAYFVSLNREQQIELIERAEYGV
ncbi:MAG: formate acetyltransferase [Desulfobacter sp.]|nr:MAG: formate acetyltransferase [Desulfobacter sp.]